MKYLYYLLILPFYLIAIIFTTIFYIFIHFILAIINGIITLIESIFFIKTKKQSPNEENIIEIINTPPKKHSHKKKYINPSWKEAEFNKQADLWNLSPYERKIAKQERMSPTDYIEAEERDDDNLDIDD